MDIKGCFLPNLDLPILNIKLENKIIYVNSELEIKKKLFYNFGFGKFFENDLILSPYEFFFLFDIGKCININKSKEELWNFCLNYSDPKIFIKSYKVYLHFRSLLWIVRDGSIYGSNFVLYSDHPDLVHSDYTITIFSDFSDFSLKSILLTRICWSIKKQAILIVINIPNDLNLTDPNCIDSLIIESICINRCKLK